MLCPALIQTIKPKLRHSLEVACSCMSFHPNANTLSVFAVDTLCIRWVANWMSKVCECEEERRVWGCESDNTRTCNKWIKKGITFSFRNLAFWCCCYQYNFIKFTPKQSNPNLERVLCLHHVPRNLYLSRPTSDTLNRVVWPKETFKDTCNHMFDMQW